TIDAFQGSEATIVCYSTVRSHGNLKFLLDKKRLNVACSRAQQHLVFFGHKDFLKNWRPQKTEINLFKEIIDRSSFEKINIKNSPVSFSPIFKSNSQKPN